MKKIEKVAENYSGYTESYQSIGLRFAYCNQLDANTYRAMFTPVQCRDYLSDVIHCEFTGKAGTIYGFSYDPKKQKIDRDRCRLLLVPSSSEMYDNVMKNAPGIMHPIEDQNGFERTLFEGIDGKYVLVEGDPIWQQNSLLIAMFTLFLRHAAMTLEKPEQWIEKLKKPHDQDQKFFHHTAGNVEKIIPKLGLFAKRMEGMNPIGFEPNEWTSSPSMSHAHNAGVLGWLMPSPTVGPTYKAMVKEVLAA